MLDFYCNRAKVCVEVDGKVHGRGDRPLDDARRDCWLAERGVFTLRVPAVEVLRNLEDVLVYIEAYARERARLHRPLDGPPPPASPGKEL